jgi:ferritin-like protein
VIDLPRSRDKDVRHLARYFAFDHLSGEPREVSEMFHDLAADLIDQLPDGPELVASLRRLLEAKDCAVRAALDL